ncbi:tyrosine-type recombinase/integrase [Streptomyces lunaelactis]|uniref:tyrosine-type recombinase/integrase n=1 Tax=Streptomyces lunaelactis TaxID=1535768 RepID=UPI0015856D2D|nr:site-specific integrase [Streptomyces lunaelactis]NUK04195.1 site-specific integrase [Streptomyces lunaelactis]NUK18630.1 site-specific integrase [Streptomyces lunaelactis]
MAVPGVARLHVVQGISMLRPQAAVFEKTLQGFADHQLARRLSPGTIKDRARIARQVQAFSGGYPWEPAWNHSMFDRWSAMLAKTVATTTMQGYQGDLAQYLTYVSDPAYEWPQVCLEMFGTFTGFALRDLNVVRHAQEYNGRPSGNRPLTRAEVKLFFGQMDPEIKRLKAAGHKGALAAARDLAMFSTTYGWGLRRRETARLETHDWRRQAKLPEFGDYAGLAVRWGKAAGPGQAPKRRMVISVWPWAVQTVQLYTEHIRPLFYVDREDDGVMFPTERDEMISERAFNQRFQHWRELGKLPDALGPHCLRHTYVTRLIESGYDGQFVTDQVGHSHAATTAIYTALSSDFKNLKVREFLDASEAVQLAAAFALADAEADMDDDFSDQSADEPVGAGRPRRM